MIQEGRTVENREIDGDILSRKKKEKRERREERLDTQGALPLYNLIQLNIYIYIYRLLHSYTIALHSFNIPTNIEAKPNYLHSSNQPH